MLCWFLRNSSRESARSTAHPLPLEPPRTLQAPIPALQGLAERGAELPSPAAASRPLLHAAGRKRHCPSLRSSRPLLPRIDLLSWVCPLGPRPAGAPRAPSSLEPDPLSLPGSQVPSGRGVAQTQRLRPAMKPQNRNFGGRSPGSCKLCLRTSRGLLLSGRDQMKSLAALL